MSEPYWTVGVTMATEPPSTPDCEPHTPSPPGYVAHAEWAEEMVKTHEVRRCRGCRRFLIWEPKVAADEHDLAMIGMYEDREEC